MTGDQHLVERAILYDTRSLRVEQVPVPAPQAGEARLAIEACGLCGSDLHIYSGHHPVLKPPVVMGHEFVGRVEEIGLDVRDVGVGDRVVAIAGRGCGRCSPCREGHFNWCEQLRVIGGHIPGGLSEEVVLPADQLVKVPEWLSVQEAALIEVAAVALHTVRRYGSVADCQCLVLGAGPVGLVLVRMLRALGARDIAVSDVSLARRDLAARSGADRVVDGTTDKGERLLREIAPRGFDVAFDCAGRQESLLQSLRLTRRGGAVVLTAIFPAECTVPMVQVQRAERSIIGVQMYERADFEEVVRLLEEGALDLKGVVTHEFPLEQVSEAFSLLSTPVASAGKILVRVDVGTAREDKGVVSGSIGRE